MLYFSKLRITLVSLVSIFFIFIAASNFQNPEDSFISKKINLGLDLQGGSYLLLEIDNEPVEIQKLQNTTTVIRNFLKDKKISFNDILKSIKKRDKSDYNRTISPLKKTQDSILINTTNLTKRACFLKIKQIMDKKLKY